ncbi:MAG: hypothetical protein GX858_04125 [Clostridiales bacterium]|nr:hypothetical protein [Clostridiales bacterium]
MNKRTLLVMLVLAAVLIGGCTPKPQSNIVDLPSLPATQAPVMELPTTIVVPEGVDPSAEEEYGEGVELIGTFTQDGQQPNAVEEPSSSYAGSTPIPLNPIDMPTPTPRAPLTFTYAAYTSSRLGLTFESVAGYDVDESSGDSIILRQPETQWLDNKGVVISLSVTSVNSSYNKNDIRKDIVTKLQDMGSINYQSWRPTNPAERNLLKAPGYYADYRGVLMDGTIIRGRVHMAILPGNKLLTLHIEHPAEYNTDYIGVYTHIRNTIKTI